MAVSMRKRSGSGSSSVKTKSPLREKIVQMYDVLLRGDDPSMSSFGANFWSEFFLLKPKIGHLEAELSKLNQDQLSLSKDNLNTLVEESLANLEEEQHHLIRQVYALQTLCGLFKTAFKLQLSGGVDLATVLLGFDNAESRMQRLITHVNRFLMSDEPRTCLKEICLKLLLILTTGTDNLTQNSLLEYMMANSVFESLVYLLSHPVSRSVHGHNAVLLLTILVQYRKYESTNPYVFRLSLLDEELALHGYAHAITTSLGSYNQGYESSLTDQPSNSGWFTTITSMVGNMFVSDEGQVREQLRACNAPLLALYEAVHLNRNFIATLGNYQTETLTGPSNLVINNASSAPSQNNAEKPASTTKMDGDDTPTPTGPQSLTDRPAMDTSPSNLLVTFLEYCSIVMQDTKTDAAMNTVKLSFLILLCITEDQYAESLMHDPNLVFNVKLHRLPMRHRKPAGPADTTRGVDARPLACSVMDLMVEFIRSHLMKRLPIELYLSSLSVIHRLLAYQKKSRVRMSYPWKELWTSLISLLKFFTSNESSLVKKMNIFAVSLQVTVLFNLFITFGDTFLPSPSSYDELYYELVRCHATFDALYSMALRYSTGGGEYKDAAVRVTNSLVNIRAITAHFNPKIEAWLSSQQLSTPTEDQILDVVKSNYDSLTLKLQDGLDQYERYSESPKHSSFFLQMIRSVLSDSRQQIVLNDLELQTVLNNFSTIQ